MIISIIIITIMIIMITLMISMIIMIKTIITIIKILITSWINWLSFRESRCTIFLVIILIFYYIILSSLSLSFPSFTILFFYVWVTICWFHRGNRSVKRMKCYILNIKGNITYSEDTSWVFFFLHIYKKTNKNTTTVYVPVYP